MCPLAVDEDKMRTLEKMDLSKPQGYPGGLPTKVIPHMEFPRVVYKHPNEPYRKIEHRNTQHEIVDVEVVPTEHITLKVETEEELKKALSEGWLLKPYLPKRAVDPVAYLYEQRTKGKSA
jgi:hypothetical protein